MVSEKTMFKYIDGTPIWAIYLDLCNLFIAIVTLGLASTVLKKINFSKSFPFKCIRKQIWPWGKVGQCQPRIIIWKQNLVGPTSPMLHTKFFWFWRRFLKGFNIYGRGGLLGHVTSTIWTNFRSRILRSHHMWNLSLIGQVVSEKFFENVDERMDDGRRSDWYTISSPMSLRLRWAKTDL